MIATVFMLVFPSLRRRHGALAVGVLAIAVIATFFAARSGRTLERQYIDSGRTIPDLLQDHAEMGNRLLYLVAIYFVLTVVWIVRSRRVVPVYGEDGSPSRQPQLISIIVTVLVVAAGALSTLSTLNVGNSGARSVWEETSVD